MVEHAPSIPRPQRRPETTAVEPTESETGAQVQQPEPEERQRSTCQHCRQPLFKDWLWGWMHTASGYLCQDPTTGERLCQPATPA
ncbi:hypothetical protein B0E53_00224 [Micromonospora sp. MH33]|nr:hypothetical protein B0E53_00224 [Micromonospora sp. MH33]